jgi:hypothetical protein
MAFLRSFIVSISGEDSMGPAKYSGVSVPKTALDRENITPSYLRTNGRLSQQLFSAA